MKISQIFAVSAIMSILFSASIVRADWITCTNSGSWGDTNIWDSNTVPGTNDFAEIDAGFVVTVDTNAVVLYIINFSGGDPTFGGTLIMAANSTLEILDSSVSGTYQLGVLDTTAPGNTVIYDGNPFYAKHCNYYNLVFYNTLTNNMDFYNGYVGPFDPAFAMTISGNMTVIGKTKVQQGDDFIINGNLLLDTNAQWDCSLTNLTVMGNLTVGAGALFFDLDGADGTNYIGGNIIVSSTAIGWNVSDVITWGIGGNLTNNGTIVGKGYGSISFDGTGVIAGSKSIKLPTITVNGTYTIADTITLTTNTPTLNGTLVFDLARTNQIVLQAGAGTPLYYNANLNVINSGVPPASGQSYQLFSCVNGFGGAFASTNFPSLSPGLYWVDNTLTSGSIAVTGAILGSPTLTLSRSGGVLTLSWDSATYTGYSVQGQTNKAGIGTNWVATGSGTVSPFMIAINPTNPPVFFRLSNQ